MALYTNKKSYKLIKISCHAACSRITSKRFDKFYFVNLVDMIINNNVYSIPLGGLGVLI